MDTSDSNINVLYRKRVWDWLDNNYLSWQDIEKNKELRDLCLWAEKELCNGAALHIIIEDGNFEDEDLKYCKDYILSGDWNNICLEYGYSYTNEDNLKMLRIIELMEPLSVEKREMISCGNTMTEDLFDNLYNNTKIVENLRIENDEY